MNGYRLKAFVSLLVVGISVFMGCQRHEKPEEQEGLDKDSHSYSYVSYDEARMKQVALDVPGVEDVRMEYNGKHVMMYIIPEKTVKPEHYHHLANQVHKKVSQTTPITPFHVRILKPNPRFDGDPGY
ncbi:hypothetical protein [Staphylospora marina]|uniref:hypothetical protein n=1 Tax=Staphylospora marina TaxID=2490858 RepID=UPI000F5C03FC|nr:hypothetical protein [Staphylospora marina]